MKVLKMIGMYIICFLCYPFIKIWLKKVEFKWKN